MGADSFEERYNVENLDNDQKEALKRYEASRLKYFNQDNELSAQEKARVDAELQDRITKMTNEEKATKEEAKQNTEKEITDIGAGLEGLNETGLDSEIKDFEIDPEKLGNINDIAEQSELYSKHNDVINTRFKEVGQLYEQFTQVVARFNKEKDDDTIFSGDTGYEKFVDEINNKIDHYKELFKGIREKLDTAIVQSEKAGVMLDNAPDELRKKEQENEQKNNKEYDEHRQGEVEKLNKLKQDRIALNGAMQTLGQTKNHLIAQVDSLTVVGRTIDTQKLQLDQAIAAWGSKIRNFKNTVISVCLGAGIRPFSDQELGQLITNPNGFIQSLPRYESKQAAANLYNVYGNQIREYLKISGDYAAGLQQTQKLSQAQVEVKNREAGMQQSLRDTEIKQEGIRNAQNDNDIKTHQTEGEIKSTDEQHAKAMEYYDKNWDEIDKLDFQISNTILDTDMQNRSNLKSIDNQIKAFDGMKVSKKSLLDKVWDGTVGLVCDGVEWVAGGLKAGVQFLAEKVREFGNSDIGKSWLFKRGPGFSMEFSLGLLEGALDMVEGVGQMIKSPLNTVKGMAALVGRDPVTGEWSLSAAGDARKNMGDAMFGVSKFANGDIAGGLVDVFLNVGLTVATGGAATAGKAAFTAARVAGSSLGRAARTGAKAYGATLAKNTWQSTKSLGKKSWEFTKHPSKSTKSALGFVDNESRGSYAGRSLREKYGYKDGEGLWNFTKRKTKEKLGYQDVTKRQEYTYTHWDPTLGYRGKKHKKTEKGVIEYTEGEGIWNYTKRKTKEFFTDGFREGSKVGGVVKNGKKVYNDFKEGGLRYAAGNYAKRVAQGLGGETLGVIDGMYRRVRGGKSIFGETFPSLKQMPDTILKMQERIGELRGGKLDKMREGLPIDSRGRLTKHPNEIPASQRQRINEYQSSLQELSSLESMRKRYSNFEISLRDMRGNPTPLGQFVKDNKVFGKSLERMVHDPSNAEKIFEKFKKQNPKTDLSKLQNKVLFKNGNVEYFIYNGKLSMRSGGRLVTDGGRALTRTDRKTMAQMLSGPAEDASSSLGKQFKKQVVEIGKGEDNNNSSNKQERTPWLDMVSKDLVDGTLGDNTFDNIVAMGDKLENAVDNNVAYYADRAKKKINYEVKNRNRNTGDGGKGSHKGGEGSSGGGSGGGWG